MTAPDIARHPHYRARDMIIEWDDDIGGRVRGTGVVPKFSGTPSGGLAGCSGRGKDTDEVLAWLGFGAGRITELRDTGVVS